MTRPLRFGLPPLQSTAPTASLGWAADISVVRTPHLALYCKAARILLVQSDIRGAVVQKLPEFPHASAPRLPDSHPFITKTFFTDLPGLREGGGAHP